MHILFNRLNKLLKPLLFLAIFVFSKILFAQDTVRQETNIRVPKGSYLQIKDNKIFVPDDTIIIIPPTLVPADITRKDRTITFYDSLKAKASKTLLTRTVFDLIIVSPDSNNREKIINNSDESYKDYTGKRIRKIEIRRLNVFGTDIQNPSYIKPTGVQNVLNKTHINTNESFIRKNLLFKTGDILSPLTLSDNERIIRQLPFIDDARIIVVPVSDEEVDVVVITKDVYSLGANYQYKGLNKGSFWAFEKNLLGMGHDFEIEIPYNSKSPESPGLGLVYRINNISKSFIDVNTNYYYGLGKRTYGIGLSRDFVSSATQYAGGIFISKMLTTEDPDTLPKPEPLKYSFQDYWLARSFLINKESVSRIIIGARYINNNVFQKPLIDPNSYYALQKYNLYIGSVSLSVQKYYKTNLIYSYGRTEDVPYGGLFSLTMGS